MHDKKKMARSPSFTEEEKEDKNENVSKYNSTLEIKKKGGVVANLKFYIHKVISYILNLNFK